MKEVPADAKYTKDETGSFKYGDYPNLQTKEIVLIILFQVDSK